MQTQDSSRAQFQSRGCLCNSHYIMSWVLIRQLLNEVFLPHPEGNSFGLSTCKHSLASENCVFDNRTPVFSFLCYKQVKDVKSRRVLQQFNLRTAEVSAVQTASSAFPAGRLQLNNPKLWDVRDHPLDLGSGRAWQGTTGALSLWLSLRSELIKTKPK